MTTPLDAYYRAIDAGDIPATVACFTDDAEYIRPSLVQPGTLEVARGREELVAYFTARGKKPHRHLVVASAFAGGVCFVEGVAGIEGEPPTHTFLATATIEDDGRISRYYALMAEALG